LGIEKGDPEPSVANLLVLSMEWFRASGDWEITEIPVP
jgi:hypothetical protein